MFTGNILFTKVLNMYLEMESALCCLSSKFCSLNSISSQLCVSVGECFKVRVSGLGLEVVEKYRVEEA